MDNRKNRNRNGQRRPLGRMGQLGSACLRIPTLTVTSGKEQIHRELGRQKAKRTELSTLQSQVTGGPKYVCSSRGSFKGLRCRIVKSSWKLRIGTGLLLRQNAM